MGKMNRTFTSRMRRAQNSSFPLSTTITTTQSHDESKRLVVRTDELWQVFGSEHPVPVKTSK